MSATRTITFLWTPATVAATSGVVLITAGLCYLAWRRSDYRRSMGLLELLRLTTVSLAALLLNQPEWVEEYRPEEKPTIALLVDASASMETRDVMSDDRPGSALTTRAEAIAPLAAGAGQLFPERFNLVVEPFATPAPGLGTDIYTPLAEASKKSRQLLGIVLVSDGDWNEGEPPAQAATLLRAKGVPVLTVPVGSPSRLPDIELLSLDVPTFGVAGKSVRIPFTIESTLPREYVTTVVLKTSDGDELTSQVRVPAMGRLADALTWKPQAVGDFTVSLSVPRQSDETIADNNLLEAPISIREERLKVLLVESYPRWEYRFLRNALSRDPGVELSCLLFHPGLSKVGGGNKDYLKEFPSGLDELSKYDVVFLGDVGSDGNQLTVEQCRLLKGLVEHQASGLVLMPGWQGRQLSLLDTELGELFPVQLDVAQSGGWGLRTPGHFELTESGRRSLLTRLADTQDDNAQVWEDLPGFQWYAPLVRAKTGTEVLAVHKEIANEYGRLPLLVTRTFGSGKVLFMGTDGAWRWRKGVEDKYHYRFWGQVVRWMAYQRNMAQGESMRVYFSPDHPRVRQTIALNANVMHPNGEPLTSGDVTARLVAPSGATRTVRFTAAEDEWGLYHANVTAQEPGRHRMTLACRQTAATLESAFFVQGVATERRGQPARPEVMEEIARVTGGKTISLDNLTQITESLAALPELPPAVHRVQLWGHPVVAGFIVCLLGGFWIGRKWVGLI